MITTLFHILLAVIILGIPAAILYYAQITPPLVKTVCWVILFIVAIIVALKLLGISGPNLG